MPRVTLYHNPRCSKSRATLALLRERDVELEIVEYLDAPLSRRELEQLRDRLGQPATEWVRRKESAFSEAGLSARSSEDEILAAIAAHPILLERPIAVLGERARIGRPPEQVLELFDG